MGEIRRAGEGRSAEIQAVSGHATVPAQKLSELHCLEVSYSSTIESITGLWRLSSSLAPFPSLQARGGAESFNALITVGAGGNQSPATSHLLRTQNTLIVWESQWSQEPRALGTKPKSLSEAATLKVLWLWVFLQGARACLAGHLLGWGPEASLSLGFAVCGHGWRRREAGPGHDQRGTLHHAIPFTLLPRGPFAFASSPNML